MSVKEDQEDYASLGITDDVLSKLETLSVFDDDIDNIEIRPSNIHGLGVFAKGFIPAGSIISIGVKDSKLMASSRYMNHSADSNSFAIVCRENACLFARKDIQDEEITIDYRTTFREDIESIIDRLVDSYNEGVKCLDS